MLQAMFAQRQQSDLTILGGGGGESGNSGGARGAAALEVHRRTLVEQPSLVVDTVRQNMARMNGTDPMAGTDAHEYWRRQGGFRQHPDLGHVASMVADIWNEHEMGNAVAAHARTGLLLMSIEQVTLNSRWEMAMLMSHSREPDHTMMARAAPSSMLRPASALAEPRWVAAASAYLRDGASVAEAFRRFKGKGKGKDKGKTEE